MGRQLIAMSENNWSSDTGSRKIDGSGGTSWASTSDWDFWGSRSRKRIQGWSLRIKPWSITPFRRFSHPVNVCWITTMCQALLSPGDTAVKEVQVSCSSQSRRVWEGAARDVERNPGCCTVQEFNKKFPKETGSQPHQLTAYPSYQDLRKIKPACTRYNIVQMSSWKPIFEQLEPSIWKAKKWVKIKKQVSETSLGWIIIGSIRHWTIPNIVLKVR